MAGSLILALVMAPSLLGSPLVARMNPRRALVASLVVVTVTTAAMGGLVSTGQEYGFMAVCAVFSVAMGVCVATSLRMLLLEVSVLQVSAILSSVNLVAYAGSAVTGLGTGALLGATSYPVVFFVMVALLVAASVFVCSSLRAPQAQRSSSRLTLKKFHKMKGVEPSAPTASESAPATLEEPAAATL